MTDPGAELLALLDLETLEVDLFRGEGAGGETTTRIYGGQVIAQALMAAYRTVTEGRSCHSLHAYFMRPGDPSVPVIYSVDRARDGGSFSTRRVSAIQHGRQILVLTASFHDEEEGWDHQHPMPAAPDPATLPSLAQRREAVAERLKSARRADFLRPRPIEIREADPQDLFEPAAKDDHNSLWFRMETARGQPEHMQHCLLAYASDMNLLGSSLRPHGLSWLVGGVITASLDHAMWFHAPIRFEDWHLYALDSPWTGKGRGYNRGSIYTADGRLVASTVQEGLVRRRREPPE